MPAARRVPGRSRDRLARGEAVQTEHAVYVNALAAGAAAKAMVTLTRPRPGSGSRWAWYWPQAFRALVSLEDVGLGADAARTADRRRIRRPRLAGAGDRGGGAGEGLGPGVILAAAIEVARLVAGGVIVRRKGRED